MPTVISGMFGAAAFRRATELVPRAEQWKPDLVVHPVTELAGAVGIAAVGAGIAVAGGVGARLAAALWLVVAARRAIRSMVDRISPPNRTA